jgi:hypothetical protein
MYELKKIGKVFTSKFVATGPSSYKTKIYRAAVSQRLKNTALEFLSGAATYFLRCVRPSVAAWDVQRKTHSLFLMIWTSFSVIFFPNRNKGHRLMIVPCLKKATDFHKTWYEQWTTAGNRAVFFSLNDTPQVSAFKPLPQCTATMSSKLFRNIQEYARTWWRLWSKGRNTSLVKVK